MPARLLTDCLSVVSGSNCRCATASRGSVTVRRARATTPAKIHRAVEAKPGTTRQYAFERFSMQQNFVLPRPIAALCGQHSGAGRVWIEKDLFRDHCLPIWLKKCGRAGGPFWAMAHVAEVRISPTSPRGCWRATANTRLLKRRYHGRWFHCFRPKSSERQRHIPHTHTYTHTQAHTQVRRSMRRLPFSALQAATKSSHRNGNRREKKSSWFTIRGGHFNGCFQLKRFQVGAEHKKKQCLDRKPNGPPSAFYFSSNLPLICFSKFSTKTSRDRSAGFFWKKNETQIELNNFQG